MRLGRLLLWLVLDAALVWSFACGGRLLRQYEYEEEIFLDLDGSATVIVNTSVAALVALRGVDLDVDPRARFRRDDVRRLYAAPAARVTRVSRPWRRDGRRFFQVRLAVDDIRTLSRVAPLAWSQYQFVRDGEAIVYRQTIGAAAGRPVGPVGWDGRELVAFRLHIPSRIHYHSAPSRTVERGNILAWEQPLRNRLTGVPVSIEVRMERRSILYRTLWLFGGAFLSAVVLLVALVWWVRHKGGESG